MQSNLLEMITIDRRSTVDYELQIKESIKALILDQSFFYHTVMPTPIELANHLNIDKKIVESTYAQLSSEGYLKTDESGQFQVSFFELTRYFFDRNTAVFDAIAALGLEPSIECIEKKVVKLKKEELLQMGFSPESGNQLLHIIRIYKGDNQPIMILENYLPISVFPDIFKNFKGDEPLNAYLKSHYGIRAEISKRIIKSVNLSTKLAKLLNERKNAASIQSTNHIYDKFGRLIDYGQSHSISSYYFQALIPRAEMKEYFPKAFK
ncbi:MAG: GntR family transcriptional regulator [Tenericutes bacterium]|nr:GntR family transcriptional regulator [Mycoplasmatota bacterium]